MFRENLNFLSDEEWMFSVKNLPIIAIDLIIKNKKSEILMGRRLNNPAKNFFFVPGGRIFKNEKIKDAFERVSLDELGKTYQIKDSKFINYFEHFYPNSLWRDKNITTHYVVLAFELNSGPNDEFNLNTQHNEFEWISKENYKIFKIHKYSLDYLNNKRKYNYSK